MRIVVEHAHQGDLGWLAMDSLELARKECMTLPHDSVPSTIGPTQGTTVPPTDDVFCTFQQDDCGFQIEGEGDFLFQRKTGAEVPAIGSDWHFNSEGMFLYANSGEGNSNLLNTYVITQEFDGDKHKVECFHFWFFLDGFLVSSLFICKHNMWRMYESCRMEPRMSPFWLC